MNTSSNTAWNGLRKPLAVAIAATLVAQAPLAGAAIFKELSKEALAEMRGKFAVGNQVQYFGMSVTTSWTNPAAVTHTARLDLQVDNSGPETQAAYRVGGTLGEPVANTPEPAPNPALGQIDGAVQAIQVSGSDNQVQNHVGYSVIAAGTAPVLGDTQVGSALPADQTFRNGDMVTQFTTTGGVGFTITSQGNQVTQRLGMNPVTNHSQLLQAVRLQGDGHTVVNDLMLQVAFENALSQSDGLRFRADPVVSLL